MSIRQRAPWQPSASPKCSKRREIVCTYFVPGFRLFRCALLFDEPTTGLDPVSARRIDRLICELRDQSKVTSVVVSHDLTSIFSAADRIAFLYQGRVHVVGTPAELRVSTDPIVQQFIAGRSDGPMETPGF